MLRLFVSALLAMTAALTPSRAQSESQEVAGLTGRLHGDSDAVIPGCADLMQRRGDLPGQLTLAFNNCGNAYFAKGDLDRAIEDYSQAIKISPQFNAAFNNRGTAYFAEHDYDRAIRDFSEAIRIEPGYLTGSVDPMPPFDYETVFRNRGSAYAASGDYDRAVEDYNEALRLQPDDADAFDDRGIVYNDKGNYDAAIADFNKALQIDPKNADVLCSRAVGYFHKNEYDRAMQDFNEAIRLKPEDADAFYNRGILYTARGDYDRSIADFNNALQISPKNAEALYSRGIAERNKNDVDRARADTAAALQIDPEIAGKVGAMKISVTPAKTDLAQNQPTPPCTVFRGDAQAGAQVPSYVDEPIEQLKRMVPGLDGIQVAEKTSATTPAMPARDKTAFILSKTGAVIADLMHRMPDLIAREEVRQPVATQEIGGAGLDGRPILDDIRLGGMPSGLRATRYETRFFSYRVVHRRKPSGVDALDEFRTDEHNRPIDDSARNADRPLSVGFATMWLFFFPGNLQESRFRYLGQQWIDNRETYVLAFAQIPAQVGLGAVIESSYGPCSTPMQGVAWIDQSTFKIVQMQTDLLAPLPGIQLNQLRSIVDYGAVKIHERNLTLWLPLEVETRWQTAYRAGDETHLYSHYRLFESTARILPASASPSP